MKIVYPIVSAGSSLFLSCSCVTVCALHCVLRRILGHYRACTVGFIPATIGGFLSIGIEKQNVSIYLSQCNTVLIIITTILTKIIAAQNEVVLSYHRVGGLYFLR